MSENVKKFRELLGWSQNELAKRSGVSQPYISELEDGKADNPSMKTLEKLANALGVYVSELLAK